jgi:hypothetical protein
MNLISIINDFVNNVQDLILFVEDLVNRFHEIHH